jgi:hypothetical protein
MKKKVNPAAARDGSEVGVTTEWWSHSDLKPLPVDVKPGHRYHATTRFDGVDLEAPPTERWENQSVTVEVTATGPGWIDERTLTYNRVLPGYDGDYQRAVRPRGPGWVFEGPVAPASSSWRRRREAR